MARAARDSTYRQILALVEAARDGGAPMVRLADRYSLVFSGIAVALTAGAWWFSGSLDRAPAVLIVATPCPVILAVPIALMSGVNRAADQKIIVKWMVALEVLARTVGRPELVRIEAGLAGGVSDDEALALAAAVERHSLHPIAKALVDAAQSRNLPALPVSDVVETVGHGIQARVGRHVVSVRGADAAHGEMRVLSEVDGREAAERALNQLGLPPHIEAECTLEAKLIAIKTRQKAGLVVGMVGMVGDGINDAPALALADVGLVFTNEGRTNPSEAPISRYRAATSSRSGKLCGSRTMRCAWRPTAFYLGSG